MNKQDLIPIIAQEECAEVIQAISKVFRFGLEREYTAGNSNKRNLEIEIGQLRFSLDQLSTHWDLDYDAITDAYLNKANTYKHWEKFFNPDHNELLDEATLRKTGLL